MKNNIKIEYRKERNGVKAIAINEKCERFILSTYANLEKAKILAPKLLFIKCKAPSTEFNRFLNF